MNNKLYLLASVNFVSLTQMLQKEIYQEFYTNVYSSIAYIVKDHAATEDIIQISFLKVIDKAPQVENENRLRAWIRVVVRNTVYTYLRKNKKNRNEVDSDGVYMNESINAASESSSIEKEVELKVITEALEDYLDDLKPEYRSLIELRWKKELSYKEIAVELETTEKIVKHKLYRARETIKKRFLKDWGEKNE